MGDGASTRARLSRRGDASFVIGPHELRLEACNEDTQSPLRPVKEAQADIDLARARGQHPLLEAAWQADVGHAALSQNPTPNTCRLA